MTTIINLTQHTATAEQVTAGVVEPANKAEIQNLLTFDEIPSKAEMRKRALALLNICREHGYSTVMLGGAPFFMGLLQDVLKLNGFKPVYAFSVRQSVDEVQADGSVVKRAVFKHAGFVEI